MYGFNLVCLCFGNQVMPDGGCVFEDAFNITVKYKCRNYVWGTPALVIAYNHACKTKARNLEVANRLSVRYADTK